ncbi:hypothetical protein NUSPORA_00164 [Nucleospora cyclopteri]
MERYQENEMYTKSGIFNKIKKFADNPFSHYKIGNFKVSSLDFGSKKGYKIAERVFIVETATETTSSKIISGNLLDRKILFFTFTKRMNVENNLLIQNISDIDITLNSGIEISKIVNFWLNLSDKNDILLEIDNRKIDTCVYLLSSLLFYINVARSPLILLDQLAAIPTLRIKERAKIKRYLKYFEKTALLTENGINHQLILNQIIITTIPTVIEGDFIPLIEINTNNGMNVYKDGDFFRELDFAIFSKLNKIVSGEIKISLYFIKGNTKYFALNLNLNTFFYEQGLYRFSREDIETNLPSADIYKMFSQEFCLDLIFIENNGIRIRNPYLIKPDFFGDMKLILEKTDSKYRKECCEQLIQSGYNKILSKFLAYTDLTLEECKSLISELESKGHKNLINHINKTKSVIENTKTNKKHDKSTIELLDEIKEFTKAANIVDLDFVQDIPITPEIKQKSMKFIKKTNEFTHESEIIAAKTLHWTPLKMIKNTIFDKKTNIQVDIDYFLFEEQFCISRYEQKESTIKSDKKPEFIDSKRLFFISLALKHLEVKKISYENIVNHIKNQPNALSFQDLQNLEKVFPTQLELEALLTADYGSLNQVEKVVLNFGNNQDIKKDIILLLYERRTLEEIIRIETVINDIIDIINKIMESIELQTLFKIILEVGNTINFTYSLNKKKSDGFKLSSLNSIINYTYKTKTLIKFVSELLLSHNVNISNLKDQIKLVKVYKKIEFFRIKQSINEEIQSYKDHFEIFGTLKDKTLFRNFFAYVSNKLLEISNKYFQLAKLFRLFQKYFGESKTAELAEIFTFLEKLIESLEKAEKLN